ncbi:MAG: hypothetical protein R3B49_08800 [Phycisphaerales bacterium]
MKVHISLLAAVGASIATAGLAMGEITAYSQDFEGLNAASTTALSGDGWNAYINVWNDAAKTSYAYGYFYGGAPNTAGVISDVAGGQGGIDQGAQQLSIYSDYGNVDHGNGLYIETNVYREVSITAANVGQTWTFAFDYKMGNIEGESTAEAFIKTLDPNNGYATTNYLTVVTGTVDTWQTGSIMLPIDAGMVGQVFQIGFADTATNYEGAGVYYDNINLTSTGGSCGAADIDGNGVLNLDDVNLFAQAFLAGCTNPPPGVNEVVNGSFEDFGAGFDPFDTWQLFGNVFADDNIEVLAQDGVRSCKMYGGFWGPGVQSDTGCYQRFAVTGDTEYTLSGYTQMLSIDPIAPLDFSDPDMNGSFGHLPLLIVDFYDTVGGTVAIGSAQVTAFEVGVDAADTWVYKTVTTTSPAGAVEAQVTPLFIQFGEDPGSLFFDNIRLEGGDTVANCGPADVDGNGVLNLDDVNIFVRPSWPAARNPGSLNAETLEGGPRADGPRPFFLRTHQVGVHGAVPIGGGDAPGPRRQRGWGRYGTARPLAAMRHEAARRWCAWAARTGAQ